MMRSVGVLSVVLASAAATAVMGPAAAAPEIEAGPRCGSSGVCFTFDQSTPPPPVVRSMTFNAPSAGVAAVSVSGTMQCVNFNVDRPDFGVIDLSAQIVLGAGEPDPTGPGGQRIGMRLPLARGALFPLSNAINLAATRIVSVTPGANVFRYKIARNRMDEGTNCNVFNTGLSVIFVP